MDSRLDASLGGSGAHVYSVAYSAAFEFDPFFAYSAVFEVDPSLSGVEETAHGVFCCAPVLDEEHMQTLQAAESVIERVGGNTAVTQLTCLFTQGYPKQLHVVAASMAQQPDRMKGLSCWAASAPTRRCQLRHTASKCAVNCGDSMSDLQAVDVRLLSAHATSA
jgi:hypothetical protein